MFIFYRLQEQYEENSSSEIRLKSIFIKYRLGGGELSLCIIGKYIRNVFPNVKAYKKWSTEDKIEGMAYKGLKEKDVIDEDNFNDISFILQSVPSPFFICKHDEDEIQLGMFCEFVNGNYLMKRITFSRNGEWMLHVGENQINLEEFSIENHFHNTRTSVQNVCSLVYKLHTCRGKRNQIPDTHEIQYKNFVVEYLGVEKVKTYRSKRCKRLVLPTAFSLACRNCQNDIRFNTPVIEMPSKKSKSTKSEKSDLTDVDQSLTFAANTTEENNENDSIPTKSSNEDMKVILEKVLPEGYWRKAKFISQFKTETSPKP